MRNELPAEGYVRLAEILGNKKANPPIPGIFPISRTTWWVGIKSGEYPKGIKLSDRTTAWDVRVIRALIESLGK